MPFNFRDILDSFKVPGEEIDHIISHLESQYPNGSDPYGLDLKRAKNVLSILYPIYHKYFKVRVFGKENLQDSAYIVASNHSGQIAIDAMLICLAFVLEMDKPRVLRPLVERFVPAIPFIGQLFAEGGAVLGDRENCQRLLKQGESVLVFPEGVRGIAKNHEDYYKLQRFTKGFIRQALQSGKEVLPVAVVGAEEFYPYVQHSRKLAKLLNAPAFPLTPTMLLGPLGLLPMPSPVDIYIGKPYQLPSDIKPEASDSEIAPHLDNIVEQIKDMILEGRKKRRPFWANKPLEED
ncbi:MAG: lysophospholipid acyltransferase family protein [Bacteriovoracaceae bacterium]